MTKQFLKDNVLCDTRTCS